MEVYQASDGGVLQLDKGLSDYDTIEAIVNEIATLADVAPENALLFLDDGRELRQSVLQEQWERGGKGSQSTPPRSVLYLYNRETFWTDPERWAVQFQEDVQLPPPLDLTTADELAAAQEPFVVAFDHLSHLQSLFQAQHRALQIAYANLAHHLAPISREFQSFSQRAQADLAKEEALLRSTDLDMALLPKVVIHEAFLRKRNKANEETPLDKSERKERKTMAEYVKKPKMEQVQESCKKNHEDHVARFEQISGFILDLQTESDQARQESEMRATEVAEEFLQSLARIEETLARVEHLLASPMGDVEQDLIELDTAMRDDLTALTGVKNSFTHDVHLHLRKVAVFQSRIAEIVQPLIVLDGDLKSKNGFPHLTRLHQLPFAYATAVTEVVRRKEFADFLGQWAAVLGETLGRLVHKERSRRKVVKQEVLDNLPWVVPALEESMTPVADLRFNGGADSLQVWEIGRAQIDGKSQLLAFAEGLRNDPDVAGLIANSGEDPTASLQQAILALRAEMDAVQGDLGNEVEISVRQGLEDTRRGGANGHVQTLTQADHQRIVQTLQDDYILQLAEVEQRELALQMRQGELQDELVRLRTDLADEMLARQTLSAELEERAQQHQDDQTDLTTALQAEMAQEKDRAQDLGVRLQEALLDIDGLRNAEQTLLNQLQAMQEDRSRNLQTLSEAQSTSRGLESELAGLRAELEATSKQLSDARQERDVALRNQSAEAEKMMRDHIAEADGDRAVLEHQNLTLSKQLEDLKREMEEKLSAARNTSTRQLDGLRAELQFTKAQLKEAQRRETVLVDELAMAKDNASVITQENNHQTDVSRDAVALARRYHETCQRLLTTINASATVSGTASTIIARPKTPPSGVPSLSEDMRESILVKSLAPAASFDLTVFSDTVMKTINVARKYFKSYKQYRDVARNKLSFNTFAKGDLALFLPTRNAANKPWAAFNQSAPHNFLKVTPAIREQLSGREWWIARVVKTDEAVATGDSPDTNPFGLAEGIRYYVHTVEEYEPRIIPLPRRATMDGSSKGRNTSPSQINGPNALGTSPSRPTKPRRTVSEMVTSPPVGDESSPSDGQDDPAPPPIGGGMPGQGQLTENASTSVPVPVTTLPTETDATVSSPVKEPSKLSTVLEGTTPNASLVSVPAPAPPRNALSPKPEAIPRNISASRLPRVPSDTRMPSSRPFSATPPRDTPLFQPSSYGRSVSISSSFSGNALASHALGKTTPAPAMATTSSNSDTEPIFPQARKRSSIGSIPSGFSPGSLDADHRPSPLRSGEVLPLPTSTALSPSERSNSGSASPGGGAGTDFTPGQSPGQGALTAASKLIRGLSMRKRTSSGLVGVPADGKDGKERPSAMDMLKRFDAGGSA